MYRKGYLHKNLKYYRQQCGLSQTALAEMLHLSRQTISSWESGRTYPDLDNLLLLSDIFNITVDELLKSQKDQQPISLDNTEEHKLSSKIDLLFIAIVLLIASHFALTGMITSVIITIWLKKQNCKELFMYFFCILCFFICLNNAYACWEHFFNISYSSVEMVE